MSALVFSFACGSAYAAMSVYSLGHADIGVGYTTSGGLEPHWHLHSGATVNGSPLPADAEYEPDQLLAFVPNPSVPRPTGPMWDFLGNSAGDPLWYLPQSLQMTKPFLGIASEELNPDDWTSLKLSLVGMTGPTGGHFSLWQSGFSGPDVKMATSDGITGADSFSLVVGGHDHYNYGFTQPGVYYLDFKWDGVHVTDGPVSAEGRHAFGVTVVPEPGETAAVAGAVLAGFALWRRWKTKRQA
ncbi:MAG: choice-of-anchor M domain-containing protein [Verrucomicrobia bacterium]|nr:choice-of-anchor M domain-containing protein [Verrucomicrobiota bacterium]